jgi:hypothetical protein
MTDTPNAPTPTTPATAEQLREDADRVRALAKNEAIMAEMQGEGGDPLMAADCLADSRALARAAAALDAEAARREAVTPTADALDAAVESSRRLLVYVVENGTTPVSLTYTELAGRIAALVAAVEARAVARVMARECVWTKPMPDSDPDLYLTCDGEEVFSVGEESGDVGPRCYKCGGRVRVVEG